MTQAEIKMEKAMAAHSSIFAWKIPWTKEPGGLQSMESLNVRHGWATSLSLLCIGEGNGNPLQRSCLENPRDGEALWAAVYEVAQSWTRLKRLSSSSSSRDQKKCTLGFALFLLLDLETTIWVIQLACWAVGDHRASAFLSPQSTTKSQQTNEWSHLRPTSPHTPYKLTSDTWANTTEISQACPSWQNSPADP